MDPTVTSYAAVRMVPPVILSLDNVCVHLAGLVPPVISLVQLVHMVSTVHRFAAAVMVASVMP